MAQGIIESLFEGNQALVDFLTRNNEISHLQVAEDSFRKTLALAAASLFEERINEILLRFMEKKTDGDSGLMSFVKRKALEGQYFKLFTWDKPSGCNTFFNLFGEDLGAEMKAEVNASEPLKNAASRFLELGHLRNCMVHQNFAVFSCDKTASEIFQLYNDATVFIEYLAKKMS